MGGRFGGRRFLERLQRQVARAEALDVFQLAVEIGEVAFFVANEPLEDLLGCGVGARGALQGGLVVGVRAGFLQLASLGQQSMAAGSAIFSTGVASDISTSPFRNRMRSASASTWPISVMAVRLNSVASGAKP